MKIYKTSQFYEDIKNYPEEYSEDKDMQDAYLYFSIGQNEETTDDSFCWIFKNNKLLATQGPTSHRISFGQDVDRYYRGWYDPIQGLLSVQPPEQVNKALIGDERDLPQSLRRSLRDKFGNNFEIKLF